MNLYKILFRHYSQKDSREGIITYLVATSDVEVYGWLRSDPEVKNGGPITTCWEYYDEPNDESYERGFKHRIIGCKGDMFDEKSVAKDLYYGATQYGWERVLENIQPDDIEKIKSLNIEIVVVERESELGLCPGCGKEMTPTMNDNRYCEECDIYIDKTIA